MSSRILSTLAAVALAISSASAQRLAVLPASDDTSQQAASFNLSPFALEKTFPVGIDVLGVYQRNDPNPANVTYWVVSRAGSDALRILDSALTTKKTENFGLAAGAAAMAPDGRTFIITAGNNLVVYDAISETRIQLTSFVDFGPSAIDAVITPDSRRLFLFSTSAQKITQIDLTTRTVIGTLSTPGANTGTLTFGANGLLYASYENSVVEIDPTVPLGGDAVRRRMTIAGRAGKVLITPDGRRALVPNAQAVTTQTGSAPMLNYFNLADGQNASLQAPADLVGGPFFDQIIMAGNNLAFGIVTTTPRKLYRINLPQISESTGVLDPPTITEAFFSSKGTLETAQGLAVSGEYPTSQRMYVSARLSQLLSTVPDGVFQIDVPRNTWLSTVNPATAYNVGQPVVLRSPRTLSSVAPATLLSLGLFQPAIAQGGRSRPLGVRVLDSDGLPIANAPVTFLSSLPGVTFEGADSTGNTTTNLNGYAYVVAIAPSANGTAQITASTPGIGSSSTFNLTIGAVDPGNGGGNNGGGNQGAAGVTIFSGDGQAQSEGISMRFPLVVRVADSQGNPLSGVPVTWTVTGPARVRTGTATAEASDRIRVTITDDKGLAMQELFPESQVSLRQGFSPITVEASTVAGGSVTFHAISYPERTQEGSTVPKPSAILETPVSSREITGRAGEVIPDAIQVRFTASGLGLGQPIPNIGIEIIPVEGAPANAVSARCDPQPAALSDQGGLASCDLRLGSVVGTGTIRAVLAGNLGEVTFNLTTEPGIAANVVKVSGDNQSGLPSTNLPNQLVVRVTSANGQALGGQVVNWSVTSGSATVLNTSTTTNAAGQASVSVALGATPGPVQIRAQVNSGTNPSATFTATVNAVVSGINKVRGDGQTAFVNAAFATPLEVRLVSNSGTTQGTQVQFQVVSGPVSLIGNPTVTADASGLAAVNVQAGSTTGNAVVRVTAAGFTTDFNLTVRPVEIFNLAGIRNVATNAPGDNPTNSTTNPGGIAPGGLYRIYATGVAQGLNGVQTANLLFGPLPKQMRGVTVQIGTEFAPIFQLENLNGQEAVVVQAPFNLTPGGSDSITIRVNGVANTVNNVPVVSAQPGIFLTTDVNNRTFVVAQHLDGRYVTADQPARLGEQIRAYFTGGGKQITPFAGPINSGEAGPGGSLATGDVVVGVNGVGVPVESVRYTPGMVGVYDVVFRVPSQVNPGDNPNAIATGPDRPFALGIRNSSGNLVVVSTQIPIGN